MERIHEQAGKIIRGYGSRGTGVVLFLVLLTFCHPLRAQEPGQPMYTLHVYNNLEQFATVVLTEDLKPSQPVAKNSFAITLDDGPVFHPTQMRREGDDPIDLAVLLDASGSQNELVAKFADAFASLSPAFLHSNDRVTIYAADCTLIRSVRNVQPDVATLRAGVEAALGAPGLHGKKSKSACGSELHLWDHLAAVSSQLAREPGRRVILLVSDGDELKSKTSFADITWFASANGTAIFLLHDTFDGDDRRRESLVGEVVARSGGMTFRVSPKNLERRLQSVIMLLRERYIIEFPRPNGQLAGHHAIAITVPGKHLFLRYTGATTPLPDPTIAADPNTLPTTESPAKLGTRKPMN